MSMEQNGNQNMSAATFCRNGCGFYAAQAFDGMCSKCYKDLKEVQPSSPAAVASSPSSASSSPSLASGRVSVDGSNKKTDVDIVATSLSRTTLGDMNLNSSSNSGSNDKLTGSGSGGAVGGVSEVETASPTVATAKTTCSSDKGDETGEGTSADGGDSGSNDGDKGKKAKKNRCMECRKKVGLTGFQCHCGKLFCSLHRYSDTHDCTFDFKEQGAQEIRKNNPVVKGEKVQKI